MTYIRLPTTFVYLACLLDAFSRQCIGWKLSRQINTRLTLAALEMAIETRQLQRDCILHSDSGVQYASTEYVRRLEEIGACVSRFSATGNPYDNTKAASFSKTVKREEVYQPVAGSFAGYAIGPLAFPAPAPAHQTVLQASTAHPDAHRLLLGRGRRPAHAPSGVDTLSNGVASLCVAPAIPDSPGSYLYYFQSASGSGSLRDAGGSHMGAPTARDKHHGWHASHQPGGSADRAT